MAKQRRQAESELVRALSQIDKRLNVLSSKVSTSLPPKLRRSVTVPSLGASHKNASPQLTEGDIKELVDDVLRRGDKHDANGSLSLLEITTYLSNTKYAEFANWLRHRRAFFRFDRDGDRALDRDELSNAALEFYRTGGAYQPTARSVAHEKSRGESAGPEVKRKARKGSPGSPKAPPKTYYVRDDAMTMAADAMKICERQAVDGMIPQYALNQCFKGTRHEEFSKWLSEDGRIFVYDVDKSGSLDVQEIGEAMLDYFSSMAEESVADASDASTGASSLAARAAQRAWNKKARLMLEQAASSRRPRKKASPISWPSNTSVQMTPLAESIMEKAELMATNGNLSILEIQTWLKGSEYEEFLTWMMKQKRFSTPNLDVNKTLDLLELRSLLCDFSSGGAPRVASSSRRVASAARNTREVLKIADWRATKNGKIKLGMLNLELQGTHHEPFVRWFLTNRRFASFTKDPGKLEREELKRALTDYYEIILASNDDNFVSSALAIFPRSPEASFADAVVGIKIACTSLSLAPAPFSRKREEFNALLAQILPPKRISGNYGAMPWAAPPKPAKKVTLSDDTEYF